MLERIDTFLVLFALLSFVVQIFTELIQRAGLKQFTLAVACVVGLVVAVTTRTGLLDQFGVVVIPAWVDWVYMGAALAGGSWVVDLLKKWGAARSGNVNMQK